MSCLTILELFLTAFVVFKSFDNLTWTDLIITGALNVFIIFFAVSTIAGVTTKNFGLLITCLVFLILELIRMGKGLYETWLDDNEKLFNKFFVTLDAVVLISMVTFLTSFICVMKKDKEKTPISLIGRSVTASQVQETTT